MNKEFAVIFIESFLTSGSALTSGGIVEIEVIGWTSQLPLTETEAF